MSCLIILLIHTLSTILSTITYNLGDWLWDTILNKTNIISFRILIFNRANISIIVAIIDACISIISMYVTNIMLEKYTLLPGRMTMWH